jgi:xylulokinase
MTYLLGIDLGTTTIKTAVIAAADARVLAAAQQEHAIHQPRPGWAEQNPDDWWTAVVNTTRRALADSGIDPAAVRGIGLSGQMHGTVCLGPDDRPLRPAIIWADTRSQPQVAAVRAAYPVEALADHAPGLPAAGYMGLTLAWLAAHEPDILNRTAAVILPKDMIRLYLTGTVGTEPSDAAATWLFDVRTGDWSPALLDICGLDGGSLHRGRLPRLMPSAGVAGGLTRDAADALGLPEGAPVVAGAADMTVQALGYGLFAPGRALAIFGTGGQVFHALDRPAIDPQLRYNVYNHAVPDRWYAQAAILSAGLALRWLRDLLGAESYAALSTAAVDVPPGADGLIFLPYLGGERTPHMDPAASGVFLGLRLHHGPGHLARAVMEGVTCALADCLDLVAPEAAVLASGGATRSPVWRQIMADVFGRSVTLAAGDHHGCVGAALLAGVGAGVYADIAAACGRLPGPAETIAPDPDRAAFYAARRAQFRRLYPLLQADMHVLASEREA